MGEGGKGELMRWPFFRDRRFSKILKTGLLSILHFSALLSSLILFSASSVHEYHVSVTQMQYNASQQLFEISIRIFTDDLEKAISQDNGMRRFLINDKDQNNPFVERYIRRNFSLSGTQKKAEIKYLGKEQEADATWIYLEIPFKGSTENWKLQNSILMETFEDQVNMFNLKNASDTKTFLFKKGKTTQVL